ncbi:MAG TPA: hypothetical protein VFZ73_08300 [Gemmatimonadaceae bacterium]
MPPGSRVNYTGESQQLREEADRFLPGMGLAIVLIFLVLAVQFKLLPRSVRGARRLRAAHPWFR